ncbi:MAG: PQQ-binding-like beta-propeller repeat protein, partial [Bacteroidaceae bacterium]|nr:PQQ-binding-like beta-propeller repeat protein [Bacteroidaceae bacterium]
MNYRKIAVFSVVALLLVACDKKEILPGKREAISGVTENIGTGRSVVNSSAHIISSPAESILEYVDIAGNKRHCSVNYRMPTSSKILWKTSIGGWSVGSDPIAFDGKVYVVNSYGNLVCVSQNNGEKLWELPIAPQTDDGDFSGGLTASGNTLYVSANTGDVIAVDTVSQKELWRKSLKYPLRGTPLIVGNRLFVNSIENQTFALDAVSGRIIWQKSTSAENTIMAASGSPALFGNDVICAYSS